MSKESAMSYPGYFQRYMVLVKEDDLSTAFKNQLLVIQKLFSSISEEKSTYAYAEGKWTLKEVLQHIIDAERIFNYRAVCFARKETTNLPGFEENDYADNSNANSRSWQSIVEEFFAVRKATELLYESFSPEVLLQAGTANNNRNSVEGIGFLTIGHLTHHQNIIEERYL